MIRINVYAFYVFIVAIMEYTTHCHRGPFLAKLPVARLDSIIIGSMNGTPRNIEVLCVLSVFLIGHSLIRCAKSCFEAEVDLTMRSDTSTPVLSRRYCDLNCLCNKHNFNSGGCGGTLWGRQDGKQVPGRLSPSVCGPWGQLTVFQVPLSCSSTEICPYSLNLTKKFS